MLSPSIQNKQPITVDPALFTARFAMLHLVRFPNGESLQDLAARSANALRLVLARDPDDTVMLVSHDSVNRALLLQFLDLSLSSYWRIAHHPCCINEIDIVDGKICVLRSEAIKIKSRVCALSSLTTVFRFCSN